MSKVRIICWFEDFVFSLKLRYKRDSYSIPEIFALKTINFKINILIPESHIAFIYRMQ